VREVEIICNETLSTGYPGTALDKMTSLTFSFNT